MSLSLGCFIWFRGKRPLDSFANPNVLMGTGQKYKYFSCTEILPKGIIDIESSRYILVHNKNRPGELCAGSNQHKTNPGRAPGAQLAGEVSYFFCQPLRWTANFDKLKGVSYANFVIFLVPTLKPARCVYEFLSWLRFRLRLSDKWFVWEQSILRSVDFAPVQSRWNPCQNGKLFFS